MTKDEYLLSLEKLIDTPLYIAQDSKELLHEPLKNAYEITITQPLARQCHEHEFFTLLQKVILRKHYQIIEAGLNIVMVFYAWHDRESRSLKFSLLTKDKSGRYPFDDRTRQEKLESIITSWLDSFIKGPEQAKQVHIYYIDLPLENV